MCITHLNMYLMFIIFINKGCGGVILKSNLSFSLCLLVSYNAIAIQVESSLESLGNLVPFVFSLFFFFSCLSVTSGRLFFLCSWFCLGESHTLYHVGAKSGHWTTLSDVPI